MVDGSVIYLSSCRVVSCSTELNEAPSAAKPPDSHPRDLFQVEAYIIQSRSVAPARSPQHCRNTTQSTEQGGQCGRFRHRMGHYEREIRLICLDLIHMARPKPVGVSALLSGHTHMLDCLGGRVHSCPGRSQPTPSDRVGDQAGLRAICHYHVVDEHVRHVWYTNPVDSSPAGCGSRK